MKRFLILLLLSLLILSSCQKEDGSIVDGEKKEVGKYPDVILENSRYIIGEEGSEPLELYAKKITFYSEESFALVEDMTFTTKGERVISGSAGEGRINTEGDEINLLSGVTFLDEDNGMKINAEKIDYNREEDTISAPGPVMVESKEGRFEGTDFKGDLRTGTYTFQSIEKGELDFE